MARAGACRLSVIVPFYQVQAFLPQCLQRIEGLLAPGIEILLIDDCGTDDSAAIAAAWAKEHPGARVIRRQQNGGLSAARNTGLDEAKGTYVYFLDSDDLPIAEGIFSALCFAERERLDVAKGRFVSFDDETGQRREGPALPETPVMLGQALFAGESALALYEPMVWQCLFRRAHLAAHGLRMAEGMLFEDELFQAPALLVAERAASLPVCLLEYRRRAGSIMRSFAKSAAWCPHYLEICSRLDGFGAQLSAESKAMLHRRIAQIALSIAKNISAYGLSGQVKKEAQHFVWLNRRQIAHYAQRGGASLRLQGAFLCLSPNLYIQCYGLLKKVARLIQEES